VPPTGIAGAGDGLPLPSMGMHVEYDNTADPAAGIVANPTVQVQVHADHLQLAIEGSTSKAAIDAVEAVGTDKVTAVAQEAARLAEQESHVVLMRARSLHVFW